MRYFCYKYSGLYGPMCTLHPSVCLVQSLSSGYVLQVLWFRQLTYKYTHFLKMYLFLFYVCVDVCLHV